MRSGGLHCVWSPPSVPQHDRTTHGRQPHNRILCGRLVCAVVRSAFSITTMRLTILTCAQKLTSSQLNLPLGTQQKTIMKKLKPTRMWANAERDGRPAEHR